jgi:hypothetical protein
MSDVLTGQSTLCTAMLVLFLLASVAAGSHLLPPPAIPITATMKALRPISIENFPAVVGQYYSATEIGTLLGLQDRPI